MGLRIFQWKLTFLTKINCSKSMTVYNFNACLSYFTNLLNILLKNIWASETEFSLARLASGKKS